MVARLPVLCSESNMPHTVSVIIPAYNAAAYVGKAIESALRQSHPPLEVLVVDDGSKDHTAEVVAAYEPAVRLVRKANGGPASARNLGAALSCGTWLALLDADDWWMPDKLAAQLELAGAPDVGLLHCLGDHRSEPVPDLLSFGQLWHKNWIINSSVLMRREVFESLGGFNESKELISVEDYNLWLRIAASSWRIATCQRVLVHYTRGIGISSNAARFMKASLYNIEDLQRRLNLPPAMVRRKRHDILFQFARDALYERDLATARQLFLQALAERRAPRTVANLALTMVPAPLLNIKRFASTLLAPRRPLGVEDAVLVAGGPGLAVPAQAAPPHPPAPPAEPHPPLLVTTVDAEEDFDWSQPFSRNATSVISMRSQHLAHRVFGRFGLVPTYMVDFPVAAKPEGRAPLLELLKDGLCDIGAQLHPWVTPPLVERVSPRNSFQCNLPHELEQAKMHVLTAEIENAFGVRPRAFRAGRYGAGPDTAQFLRELGYQVDSSVLPCWNFRRSGGPDFRGTSAWPYWVDAERSLLELPISAALVGRATAAPRGLTSAAFGPLSETLGLPSALARLRLLERIKLTPEGITIEEAKRLVRHMFGQGHRIFVLTYHTPSLEIGNTPYVNTPAELTRFLDWIEQFLEFFMGDLQGRAARWSEVYAMLRGGTAAVS